MARFLQLYHFVVFPFHPFFRGGMCAAQALARLRFVISARVYTFLFFWGFAIVSSNRFCRPIHVCLNNTAIVDAVQQTAGAISLTCARGRVMI